MLCLKARAKINWTLDILGVREDGYHLMDMLMQSVSVYDTLWLELADRLSLEPANAVRPAVEASPSADRMSAAFVSYGPDNLVYRAAELLRAKAGIKLGARMRLAKRIPSGAGMGGGSADAAAALVGLNELWRLGLSGGELREIGLSLGADIPFMLTGGLARVGGIGETIVALPAPPPVWLVLMQPCGGLSTREVFSAFDTLPQADLCRPDNPEAQRALLAGDLLALGCAMNNVLESVSLKSRPAMAKAIAGLEEAHAVRAMMTGSGSVVYGVFEARAQAEQALSLLRGSCPVCLLAHTESSGIVRG